ncbi:Phosphatidate cytidylyltransferase [Kalmanozyma brasiliensis GHG001]|uniref:Phosphatidate cytidylyltransferase n=1 Tax=Kalmanozyma brasiliensis (strain GHG001) TaxID=1365824 RepID=V5EUI9_KALBG|nr:Phosphatidate cytidylyltransferase [Kalmanozyma brasiliensis GHG001]EST05794.1 Phosphatidate cytidylyltransferase [Kalmanozyma brasiliensis GHG001]
MASSHNGGRFASRTAFEALQVEEIESDEEEVVQQKTPAKPAQTAAPKASPVKEAKKPAAKDKAAAQPAKTEAQFEKAAPTPSKGAAAQDTAKPATGNGTNGVNGHESLTSTIAEKVGLQSDNVPTPPAPFAPGAPKQGKAAAQPTSAPAKLAQAAETKLESVLDKAASAVGVDSSQKDKSQPAQRQAQPEPAKPQPMQRQLSNPQQKQQQSQGDASADSKAFWKKVWDRTLFGFAMIGGFIGLVLLGHPYLILFVMVCQTLVYREVVALFNIPNRPSVTGGGGGTGRSSRMSSAPNSAAASEVDENEEEERIQKRLERRRDQLWSKTLSWYFFAAANYFLYGESIIYYFKHIVFVDAYFIPFARHHRFLSFMLYVFGFMAFVSNLKRRNLKYQFGLFCWVHMSLLLIVFSSHFMVNNILEGLIWLWVPACLVVCNDVFAYVCGMTFGRTPLIDLSPKKTVEGFVGAFFVTEVFAFGWATLFQRYNYFICPAVSLGMNAFKEITCEINPVFHWHYLSLPPALSSLASSIVGHRVSSLPWTPFQLHALVLASFASLVAPFGGFFASGFKRAFNIKDFGDSIPGHGGLTDRFDCQFLMGLFTYVYYTSLIREHHVTVGTVLQTVVTQLTLDDQIELYNEISRYLVGQGKLPKA